MFEIIDKNGQYVDFVIARRSVNCNDITCEEFVTAIREDYKEALNSYAENAIPRITEFAIKRNKEYVEQKRERTIKRAISYAEKKWKTEKRRNQHIQEVINELDSEINDYNPRVDNISFFDMNGNCGTTMGINSCCILSAKDIDNDDVLIACYNALQKTIYFKKAIGWQFMYDGDSNTYRSSFRPQIKLLFDEKTTNEIKESQESLARAVENFYSGSNWWGD